MSQQLESLLKHLLQECKTPEDYLREFLLGRLLSLYAPEVAEFVQLRNWKTGVEAANLIQDHLDNRQYWRDRRQHQNQPWSSRPFNRGGATASGFREEGRKQDPASREPVTKSESLKYVNSGKAHRDAGSGSSNSPASDRWQNGPWIPTCFACGTRGHKRPECPNKVGRIIAPGKLI